MKNNKIILLAFFLVLLCVALIGMTLLTSMKLTSYRNLANAVHFETKNDIVESGGFSRVEHLSSYEFIKGSIPEGLDIDDLWVNTQIEVYSAGGVPARFAIFIIDKDTKDILFYYWVAA
ncbi:hypothetical protein [Ruficoccus sp. ZRK36]|uniref:hypothetical protein n=1 Tax=Ruficoccus sp. ZRK36 TaxID=2866311 RepID=UPI001C72B0CC|nr:hypothetical protein [Ruficoccus sp. ZRK36]QYY37439.1 hypothetical protein K0V07_08115 [Ruficoccus sp. ZRK36]